MKKLSNTTIALLISLGTVLLSVILQSAFLLWGGLFAVFISLICCAKSFVNKILKKSGRSYYPSFWLIVIIGYILFAATSIITIGFINEWDFRVGTVITIIIFNLLASVLYTYLYFLPYLIANKHEHTQTRAIYILNIFAGWTLLAWFIALIWANTIPKDNTVIRQEVSQSSADELRKYKDLFDQNIITKEEFEAKKKQLLDL